MSTGYTTVEQVLRALSVAQLEAELEACLKEWPQCKNVRIRLAMARLIADVALALQASCIDKWLKQIYQTKPVTQTRNTNPKENEA